MSDLDLGYRTDKNNEEANKANAIRIGILRLIGEQMALGLPEESAETQALVARYRQEYVDQYLFRSTLDQLRGLALAVAVDPFTHESCDAVHEGVADYFSRAMLHYCQTEKAKQAADRD